MYIYVSTLPQAHLGAGGPGVDAAPAVRTEGRAAARRTKTDSAAGGGVGDDEETARAGESFSKAFALTWYRALTWYSSPARPFAAPCRDGRSATRYRAAREPLPRVPTAFQGSNCVRGGLKRRGVPS